MSWITQSYCNLAINQIRWPAFNPTECFTAARGQSEEYVEQSVVRATLGCVVVGPLWTEICFVGGWFTSAAFHLLFFDIYGFGSCIDFVMKSVAVAPPTKLELSFNRSRFDPCMTCDLSLRAVSLSEAICVSLIHESFHFGLGESKRWLSLHKRLTLFLFIWWGCSLGFFLCFLIKKGIG